MKKLLKNYTFDKAAKTVTLLDYTTVAPEGLLLIVNQTDGILLYNFADPTIGATVAGNVVTLEYDTTSMANSDVIQIFYDDPDLVPVTETSMASLQDLTEAMLDTMEQLTFLSSVRGIAADLRVTLLSGTLTTLSTVTTVTTVTTLGTLSNITNVGGFSAPQVVPSAVNQTAIQSNINNVVVS